MAPGIPDWSSGIPMELLTKIFNCCNFFNRAPFAAVCRPWYKAFLHSKLLPQPYLMLSMEGHYKRWLVAVSADPDPLAVLHLPEEFFAQSVIGSTPEGYLVIIDARKRLIVKNPQNKVRIQFPSFEYYPRRVSKDISQAYRNPRQINDFADFPYPNDLFHFAFYKVVISPLSSTASPTAAVIYQTINLLMISMAERWVPVEYGNFIRDVIFYNQMLYAVNMDGAILIWDINHQSPILVEEIKLRGQVTEKDKRPRLFLVHCAEELLVVWRRSPTDQECPQLFKVFKLEMEEDFVIGPGGKKMRYASWNQIYQIGNYNIFLGINQSLVLSLGESQILTTNSIYFTNDPEDVNLGVTELDVGVYDIETQEVNAIPAMLRNPNEWDLNYFEKCLKSTTPVWFFPSLPG